MHVDSQSQSPFNCEYAGKTMLIEVGDDSNQSYYPTPICDASTQAADQNTVIPAGDGCLLTTPKVNSAHSYSVSIWVPNAPNMIQVLVATGFTEQLDSVVTRTNQAAAAIGKVL